MEKRTKILIAVVFVALVNTIVWYKLTQKDLTDFKVVTTTILDKEVEGFAVSLSEIVSLSKNEMKPIDVETDTANGPLRAWENDDCLAGCIIDLFEAIEEMEPIEVRGKFSDTGYWHVWLNVDFVGGTHNDEPHKLAFLIDKETYNIVIPEVYDMHDLENISFTNHITLRPGDETVRIIEKMVDAVNELQTEATEPADEVRSYTFGAESDGWQITDVKIRLDSDGLVKEFSGEMQMSKAFEYYNLEVYQLDGNERHSLYNDSYSLVGGVNISVDFSDKDLHDEKFDFDENFFAEVRIENEFGETEIVEIDVVENE